MGQSNTKNRVDVLKCPEGYDKENFRQICLLFDKLDNDSNLGVSSHELTDIAQLHVKNCNIRLEARLSSTKKDNERECHKLDSIFSEKLALLNLELEKNKNALATRQLNETKRIEEQIEWYSGLDEVGKCKAFMKVVSGADQDIIDFQSFFEYMKHRTDDIDNITYTK